MRYAVATTVKMPSGIALALLLTVGPAAGQDRIEAGTAAVQEPIDVGARAVPDGTIKITNAAGSLRVTGWDRDSVAVTGSLGSGAERLAFSVEGRETRIRVVIDRDARDIAGSRLEVRVPGRSQVAARTSSADIEVSDVTGGLDLESVSGAIRVEGRPKLVYAESAGGDIELDVLTKVVRAHSIDGNVGVRVARGYLEASTVSGDILVIGERLWEGEVTSVSGDIRFEGDFDSGGSFAFENHGGRITLTLPSDIPADFDITTLAGASLTNPFAGSDARSFAVGGGGTHIRIKSFKGDVILKRR